MSGPKMISALRASMDATADRLNALPAAWLLILAGMLCFPAKGVELFLVFEFFADRMRDGLGNLAQADWWTAMSLAVFTVVALTVAVHMMLIQLAPRTRLAVLMLMGIAALIAIAANPVVTSDPAEVLGQNSFDVPGEPEAVASWFFWIAEVARLPVYVIAAVVAGLGLGWLINGIMVLRARREGNQKISEGDRIMEMYEDTRAEVEGWTQSREMTGRTMQVDVIKVLAAFAEDEASRAEAYLFGPVVSGVAFDETMDEDYEPMVEISDPAVMDVVRVLAPQPVNYRALPSDGRTLPEEARKQLADYAAFLRQHYTPNAILEEMTQCA